MEVSEGTGGGEVLRGEQWKSPESLSKIPPGGSEEGSDDGGGPVEQGPVAWEESSKTLESS